MEAYFKLLESYRGRDKILRLCTFAAMAGAGGLKGESARRLLTIAGQIGEARTVLRLYDGLPMFMSVLRLGLASNETNSLRRLLTLLSTWSIQLFYPFEFLAWAGKYKVLSVKDTSRWAGLSVAMWAIYLIAQLLKSILKIPDILKTIGKLKKQKVLDPAEGGGMATISAIAYSQIRQASQDPECSTEREQNEVIRWSIGQLQHELRTEYLSLVQNTTDLMNAVHWLPQGWFWSGKLSLAQSGSFGIISTLVMIYSSCRTPPSK